MLMARGGQQRAAELMAQAPGKGYFLFGDCLALRQGSYYPREYLRTLRAPGLEKIVDISPMKASIVKEGYQFEWGAREAGGQCCSRGVWGEELMSRISKEVA